MNLENGSVKVVSVIGCAGWTAVINCRECSVLLQQRHGSDADQAARRKVTVERRTVPTAETKLSRKRRKLPAAMIPYIKHRRKRRLLSTTVDLPSSSDTKPEDIPVKSGGRKVVVKPAGSRLTSAGIVSRYRHLDRWRSQTRPMSGRTVSLAENGTRPSTRSQTAAIMHRQLVMARMKSHDEVGEQESMPQQHGGKSAAPTIVSKHTGSALRSDLSLKAQTVDRHTASQKRASSEATARRSSALDVKNEVSGGKESERSMRRFIRRRNVDTSEASRGMPDITA